MLFLISLSHGEYDDHVSLPFLVVPDEPTAQLVCEEIRREGSELREKAIAFQEIGLATEFYPSYEPIEQYSL